MALRTSHQRGFTLIELLVVISIIAVLAAMVLPAINMIKQSALSTKCRSNMRQLAIGAVAYSTEQDGLLPVAFNTLGWVGNSGFSGSGSDFGGLGFAKGGAPGDASITFWSCIAQYDVDRNQMRGCPAADEWDSAKFITPNSMKNNTESGHTYNVSAYLFGRGKSNPTVAADCYVVPVPISRVTKQDNIEVALDFNKWRRTDLWTVGPNNSVQGADGTNVTNQFTPTHFITAWKNGQAETGKVNYVTLSGRTGSLKVNATWFANLPINLNPALRPQ